MVLSNRAIQNSTSEEEREGFLGGPRLLGCLLISLSSRGKIYSDYKVLCLYLFSHRDIIFCSEKSVSLRECQIFVAKEVSTVYELVYTSS